MKTLRDPEIWRTQEEQHHFDSQFMPSPQKWRIICSFLTSLLAKAGKQYNTGRYNRRLQRVDSYYCERDIKYTFMSGTQRQSPSVLVSALREIQTASFEMTEKAHYSLL